MVAEMVARPMSAPTAAMPGQPPRLLDQLFQLALQRGHSDDTAAAYVDWSRRYILFHAREKGIAYFFCHEKE
jgi:hypothetical protein